jgi:hypothetical protein
VVVALAASHGERLRRAARIAELEATVATEGGSMITDETRDRAQRLRERVDADYADAWDFKELPLLVGVVESYARVETVHGPRVVCTIVEAESEWRYAVWLSQTALLRRFQELRPAIGELIAIRYLGVSDQPPKPGQSPPTPLPRRGRPTPAPAASGWEPEPRRPAWRGLGEPR